jgi:4-hydroxy-tetrahydrodipicolinate synthase
VPTRDAWPTPASTASCPSAPPGNRPHSHTTNTSRWSTALSTRSAAKSRSSRGRARTTRERRWNCHGAPPRRSADGLLLISPYYNKPEPEGYIEHYRTIADAVDLPQIVYNVPSRTGRNILPDTAVELASHPNILGYKAASGDLNQISEVVERTRDEEFQVLSGDDGLTLPVLSIGGTGTISVTANVEPERTVEMVHAALDGDFTRAREIHHALGPLFRQLFVETNPIPVKEAMAIRGYGPAHLRLPLTRMREDNAADLERVLADLADGADAGASEDGDEVVAADADR